MDELTEAVRWPWRTGTSVGRTIYGCPPGASHRNGEVLIGLMDTPELAREAVAAHNSHVPHIESPCPEG